MSLMVNERESDKLSRTALLRVRQLHGGIYRGGMQSGCPRPTVRIRNEEQRVSYLREHSVVNSHEINISN